jgi:hypothetical protein
MFPELLEFFDERVLQLVECRENGIGEVLAHMPEDMFSGTRVRDCRMADRAGVSQLANPPAHCDDCPNYPAPPRSAPCLILFQGENDMFM